MDQVASGLEARIDYLLDYLLAGWHELPAIAGESDSWDSVAREVFDLEWDLKEERLEELATDSRVAESLRRCKGLATLTSKSWWRRTGRS